MTKSAWRVLGALTSVVALAAGSSACDTSDGRDETAETGTVSIVIDGAEGLDGYRLLAGVWDGPDIVGGAFWTLVDDDPFSGSDVVHPPNLSDESNLENEDGWGAGDYLWDETAALQPGTYQVDLWANPGELRPYGSYIPASPIERSCRVDVDVVAGESATVTISDIPAGDNGFRCDTPDSDGT